MDPARKRQKVSSACERCRRRKLGCDQQRPCQLCVRAGVTCIPRGEAVARSSPTVPIAAPVVQQGSHDEGRPPSVRANDGDTVVLPELNIVDLSTRMFSRIDQQYDIEYDTSALPGGKKPASPFLSSPTPWRDTIGIQLPEKDVLDALITQFFDSVDWFMMVCSLLCVNVGSSSVYSSYLTFLDQVFHEGSFRQRYEHLIASVHVAATDNNFLWLVLLVLALGAHYSSLSESLEEDHQSLPLLSERLLAQIEYKFLRIIGCPNVEAVQVCVLLGSFHLFNGRPTVGLGILGSGIKIAQVLGLHRESMWQNLSDIAQESRRRSWWALEVFDKYAAIAFGRPCSIDDSDCNIGLVTDVGDISPRQGPLLEYHRWKFRLYRTMGPFLGRRLQTNRVETVKSIHSQLVTWEGQFPDILRLETYTNEDTSRPPSLLQLAALALQLTYDNLRIILHRSVAFGDVGHEVDLAKEALGSEISNFSRQQLLESALRTSELYRYPHLLEACRRTHAVMHIGICLFTSGVVLCALALMEPLSVISQKAKAGIMRIIRLQRERVSSQHVLSLQSVKILEDLVAVVMQAEQRTILGDPISDSSSRLKASGNRYPANSLSGSDQTQMSANSEISHTLATTQTSLTPLQEADSGLADASQLWLWSDNLGYQSFAELSDILH
ncbi:Zn(II)2Cys6 transcription factor [Aspergillus alliaceus]|uniref:Zn(II)2Cys6 transcription factor n=1 Tax=Petromyces alliaceus TaxID=209559 RepID=UPI0012A4D3F5|nr:fungal-specific transcription factor domain-containing protein [Aspergillus alliaceus]KAB8233898.1 fungal-specific transcription factor domain-containing protein [Aspergillus alliaceus]